MEGGLYGPPHELRAPPWLTRAADGQSSRRTCRSAAGVTRPSSWRRRQRSEGGRRGREALALEMRPGCRGCEMSKTRAKTTRIHRPTEDRVEGWAPPAADGQLCVPAPTLALCQLVAACSRTPDAPPLWFHVLIKRVFPCSTAPSSPSSFTDPTSPPFPRASGRRRRGTPRSKLVASPALS